MIIDLRRIPEDGMSIEGEEPGEILELAESGEISPAGTVKYALQVQLVTHELLVQGSVWADVKFVCSRCTDSFVREIRDDEFFCERPVENLNATVDLTDELRESIILAFSNFPVCREACRGLCPYCGANKNRKKCGCKEPKEKHWSAFSGLEKIEVNNGGTQTEKVEKSDSNASEK
jgi:uncharacterized protein